MLIIDAFSFEQTKQWSVGRGLEYTEPEFDDTSRTSGVSSIIRI